MPTTNEVADMTLFVEGDYVLFREPLAHHVETHGVVRAGGRQMKLYIDTRGHSRDVWRSAPNGARIAAHTDAGVVELHVTPAGDWTVMHGPPPNTAGGYTEVARGTLRSA